MTDLGCYLLEALLNPACYRYGKSSRAQSYPNNGRHRSEALYDCRDHHWGVLDIYFNFFKGRTYRIRLELSLTGKIVTLNGTNHLVADMSLKNVGLSKVEIEQKGSALQVLTYEAPVGTRRIVSAAWEELTAFPVFESHQWIEPGERIDEQRLAMMPTNARIAVQLHLHVVSKGISWVAVDTVLPNTDDKEGKEGVDDE